MNLQSATVEQIAIFKAAAAQRYLERGIAPKVAGKLFDTKMAEISKTLVGEQPAGTGITRDQMAEKIASAVNDIRKQAQMWGRKVPSVVKRIAKSPAGQQVGGAIRKGVGNLANTAVSAGKGLMNNPYSAIGAIQNAAAAAGTASVR